MKKHLLYLLLGISIPLLSMCSKNRDGANLVVATDGTGDYTSINDAISAAPDSATEPFIILIKNGVYNEKVLIDKPFICLVGESKDSTQIVYAILNEKWDKENPGIRWGNATINLSERANDCTIANLTAYNNYGSTVEPTRAHQFCIFGRATRTIIINANIWSDGADDLSLWCKDPGMYYHADCFFRSPGVDYVCPRGWCYITDSKFLGGSPAQIWHDGTKNKDCKFVIKNSYFDAIESSQLGRYHKDSQFYLIDCTLSKNIRNNNIEYAYKKDEPLKNLWGERIYYYGCKHEGGDYKWLKNNLQTAEGSPHSNEITAYWTFGEEWDPEETMPAVLPFAYRPKPENNAKDVSQFIEFRWIKARNAQYYNVHWKKEGDAKFNVGRANNNYFEPPYLEPNTTYTWRVDAATPDNTIKGKEWTFTTTKSHAQPNKQSKKQLLKRS